MEDTLVEDVSPEIEMLRIKFSEPIKPWDLPALRGAIAQKAGLEHDLFHNHNNETGGYHHRYPLIQYKIDSRTEVPVLLCLKEGVHEIQHFFTKPDLELTLNGKAYSVRVEHMDVRIHRFRILDAKRRYHIKNWLPFNPDNYRKWLQCDGLLARVSHLEGLLTSHIVAVIRQLGLPKDARFELRIEDIKDQRWPEYNQVKIMSFDVVFSCNLHLPDFLGVGQGASSGWGVVKRLRDSVDHKKLK